MKKKLRNVTLLMCLLMMLTLILTASAGCIYGGPPLVSLIIENQTDQLLTIILDGGLVGNVKPSGTITRENLDIGLSKYIIEAKNTQGEIVFSRSYVFEDLQEVNDGVYKVVIPPLQDK